MPANTHLCDRQLLLAHRRLGRAIRGTRHAGLQPAVPANQGADLAKPASWRSGSPARPFPAKSSWPARFKVSQGTVRKAIDELAAENLLVRRQGKGTFVATHAERHIQYRFLQLIPDDGDPDSEGPAQRRIIDCKRTRAPAPMWRAPWLCASGDAVLQVRRVLSFARHSDHSGRPVAARRPFQRA